MSCYNGVRFVADRDLLSLIFSGTRMMTTEGCDWVIGAD